MLANLSLHNEKPRHGVYLDHLVVLAKFGEMHVALK
jgi:hypothetical protein